MTEGFHEVFKVGGIEGSVYESFQSFQVIIIVVHHKIIRGISHEFHQADAVFHDGNTAAPGNGCGQESGYFNGFLQAEKVRECSKINSLKLFNLNTLSFLVIQSITSYSDDINFLSQIIKTCSLSFKTFHLLVLHSLQPR